VFDLPPWTEIHDESLQLQTDFSMRCYQGYMKAQEVREAIDGELETAANDRSAALQTLRGTRLPGEPDILYGHIVSANPQEETVVGLQHKFLWVMYVLQSADARPTKQAMEAVTQLEKSLGELLARWTELK